MAVDGQAAIIVPFGIERWSPADVRADGAVGRPARAEAPFPCLLLPAGHDRPLRLNGVPLDLFASAQAPIDRDDALNTLRNQILALCDPWNQSATSFVERYFRAAEAAVVANAGTIAAETVGCGSLFVPRDWAYSAPCPLPRAHLAVQGGTGGEAAHVAVDFAFWTGAGFVAVDAAPPRLLPKAARERRERLAAAGIPLLDRVPAGDDPAAWMSFFAALLAPPLETFWQGETVPLGLFRSNALDDLDTLVLRQGATRHTG